ncbi:MAG: hypothetical protein R2788_24410 [Saprospiraceae bacterium]
MFEIFYQKFDLLAGMGTWNQTIIYFFCDNPITAYLFIILGITLLSAGIIFYKRINQKIKTTGLHGCYFLWH